MAEPSDLDLLWRLLALDGPSGDEGALADWLEAYIGREWPDVRLERLGDSLVAVRGERPGVAVFAHTDTTGFTLGYDRELIPIGGPAPRDKDPLRPAGGADAKNCIKIRKSGGWKLGGKTDAMPWATLGLCDRPERETDEILSPYLDNRAGVWAVLQVLGRCPNIAVAFTVGEELSGQGAFVCARRLWEQYGVTQALISDITWHTAHIRSGDGVAISLRDRFVPRQRFLDRVLALAETSGLPFQREVESSGGSDGASIERSGVPMEWVFVGAPEKKPHTSHERVAISDLRGMADMLTFLVNGLKSQG